MKRILILSAAICALFVAAVFAFGDIARPKPTPKGKLVLHTGLSIVPDAKATEARLQITRDELKSLRAALADSGGDDSMTQRVMHSSPRTIMAGLFIFLAVSFGGVWLARSSQRRSYKAIAAVLLVAFVFGTATVIVRANAGPPGYVHWASLPQNLKDGKESNGGLDIEIVPGDGYMKLIIPLRNTPKQGEE